jgi:hypothetical protein
VPYTFYVNDTEVGDCLRETLEELGVSSEGVIAITYQPLAVFRVRPVVRCTDTMPGHTEVRLPSTLTTTTVKPPLTSTHQQGTASIHPPTSHPLRRP